MTTTYLVAIDLAKRHFQVCTTDFSGKVLFNRAFSRQKLMVFLSGQSRCIVAMEACSTSHYWGRLAEGAGHEVRLIPPIYVKPFVKRQKNDAADAEAISEAARRPNLHFVAVKSAEHQARAVTFRTHQCFCEAADAADQRVARPSGGIRHRRAGWGDQCHAAGGGDWRRG